MEYRLDLLAEAKIKDLLKDVKVKRYEASGIQYRGGHFYIVFDNMPHPVRIPTDVDAASEAATLIEVTGGEGGGYEDITYQPLEKRWYCLIEADETKSGQLKPRVDAYDDTFDEHEWLKAVEIAWTPSVSRYKTDRIQFTYWDKDERETAGMPNGSGWAVSASSGSSPID